IKEDQWRLSLHLDLAKLYFSKRELQPAIEELQLALKDQARASFTHNLLGLCFKEDGRFDLAEVQFAEALRMLPPELSDLSKVIGFNLGSTLEAQGLIEEAIAQYQAVLSKDINYGRLQQRINYLSASNPASLRNKALIGIAPVLASEKVVVLWGRDGRSLSGGKGVELLNISFGQDHNRAGFEYFMKGMNKSAKEELILATSLDPGLASALNNLGMLLLKEGNLEEAESKLSRAIDCDPTASVFHSNLGLIHYLNKNYKDAEMKFKRALSLDASLSPTLINLGDVLYLEGNAKQAIAQWEKVKEFDLVSEFAKRRLLFRTL
ncbi:MAG: tetratricopeptide repeat protein, partial [Candidatus Saganbacteria bacterium]|nr:tetratricopeptide repeat protein [Candidatus Saganbacteria bacterium]